MTESEVYKQLRKSRRQTKELENKLEEITRICSNTQLKPVDKITPIYNIACKY